MEDLWETVCRSTPPPPNGSVFASPPAALLGKPDPHQHHASTTSPVRSMYLARAEQKRAVDLAGSGGRTHMARVTQGTQQGSYGVRGQVWDDYDASFSSFEDERERARLARGVLTPLKSSKAPPVGTAGRDCPADACEVGGPRRRSLATAQVPTRRTQPVAWPQCSWPWTSQVALRSVAGGPRDHGVLRRRAE